MGKLENYQAKRNFRLTNEPKGRVQRDRPLLFVVQKHAATHLHYDFRLELDGFLLSWAVPKGPCMDPAVRRLAVHVENHPVEYADFEGIIPAGQYGGGTVMIWDKGSWKPDGDARKAYKKGHLSFQLNGKRLRGGWILIRSSGAGDGRQWLLIKRRDSYATGESILEQHTNSAVSGRTMEEIRADGDRVWSAAAHQEAPVPARLPGSKKRTMPERLIAEKAQPGATVPEENDWLHEIKYDGYRLVAFIRGRNVRLLTYRGNDWTDRFPSLRDALEHLDVKSAILDGEAVALTPQGSATFQKLQNALHDERGAAIVFFIFDMPYLNGYDLTNTPLSFRKEALKAVIQRGNADSVLQYSDHVRGNGKKFFDFSCRSGLEGIVSKKAGSLYRQERSDDWLKFKCRQRQEFVVGGFTEPSGSRTGFGALLLGVYGEDEKLKYCGKVGTGFTQSVLTGLYRLLTANEQKVAAFDDPPRGSGIHWTAPVLVAEVEFLEWTNDHHLRQPSFRGLREDKPPGEVHREKAVAGSAQRTKKKALGITSEKNRIAEVQLSHPEKILFPEQGLTKQDLAEYYSRIADWILPHIINRPLMLMRCPQGSSTKCFYQKHISQSLPGSIRTVSVLEKGKKADLICIDDLRGLITLVQMDTLEFHVWGSSAKDPETPDRLVFDLDPAEKVGWTDVMEAARELRDLLKTLELTAFVRTTGGKGLHVVCPLAGRLTWDTLKAFSGAVAREMAHAYPDRYVATMSKAVRTGKIFIDYFRNEQGATAIASYSTRAREGAPVAAPLAWAELRPSLNRSNLTALRLPRRLSALKSDPWEGFLQSRQSVSKTALRAMGVKK